MKITVRSAQMLLTTLALMLSSVSAIAQSPEIPEKGPKPTRPTLKAYPEVPGWKVAFLEGAADSAGQRFIVPSLDILQGVSVMLITPNTASDLRLQLFKDNFKEPLREASTKDWGIARVMIRTQGALRVLVSSKEGETDYQLAIWVSDEQNVPVPSLYVPMSQAGAALVSAQTSATPATDAAGPTDSRGRGLPAIWIIAILLLVIAALLALMLFRKRQASTRSSLFLGLAVSLVAVPAPDPPSAPKPIPPQQFGTGKFEQQLMNEFNAKFGPKGQGVVGDPGIAGAGQQYKTVAGVDPYGQTIQMNTPVPVNTSVGSGTGAKTLPGIGPNTINTNTPVPTPPNPGTGSGGVGQPAGGGVTTNPALAQTQWDLSRAQGPPNTGGGGTNPALAQTDWDIKRGAQGPPKVGGAGTNPALAQTDWDIKGAKGPPKPAGSGSAKVPGGPGAAGKMPTSAGAKFGSTIAGPGPLTAFGPNWWALPFAVDAFAQWYQAMNATDQAAWPQYTWAGMPGIPTACAAPVPAGVVKSINQTSWTGPCGTCFEKAHGDVEKMLQRFEKLRRIHAQTVDLYDKSLSFGNAAAMVGGVITGAKWMEVRNGIQQKYASYNGVYDAKVVELGGSLETALRKVAACEAQYFDNESWYDRYGFMFVSPVVERHRR